MDDIFLIYLVLILALLLLVISFFSKYFSFARKKVGTRIKRGSCSYLVILVYFPILLVFIEIIEPIANAVEKTRVKNWAGTFDVFSSIAIPLFLLVILTSFGLVIIYATKVDAVSTTRHRKILWFLLAYLIIVLLAVYGYLRLSGELIYLWDSDGVPKPSTGEYSGFFLLTGCFSAAAGLVGYKIFHIFKTHA